MTSTPSRWDRGRSIALVALAGWASLLSIESWFRTPGMVRPERFPPQLEHQGRLYRRQPAASPAKPLPGDLVILEAADYLAAGRPRLALRWLTLPSSGRSQIIPLEKLPAAVLGPGAQGFCQLAPRPGSGAPRLATAAQLSEALEATAPQGAQRWLWLAGLRPYRSNACLWTGWRVDGTS